MCLLWPGFPQGFLQAALGFHKYPRLWLNIFVILLWVSTGVSSSCRDISCIWYTVLRICKSTGMIDASVNMGLQVSCGLPAGFHSVSCKFSAGFPWGASGFPPGFLWVPGGFPVVVQRVRPRFPVGFLWVSGRLLAGWRVFLWLSRGILAGFLQVSRGFPIRKPMIPDAHFEGHIRYLKMVQNRGRRTWT